MTEQTIHDLLRTACVFLCAWGVIKSVRVGEDVWAALGFAVYVVIVLGWK